MEYQYVGRRSGALTLVSVAAFFCCVLVLFGEMMSELAELRWGTYVPLGGSSRFSLPFFSSLVLSVACAGAAAVWAVFPGTSYRFALTGPAIVLAFLSALFVFIPTCVANVRLVSLPPISATLLGAITPIPAAFFARLMIGNDGRRWSNAATCSAVVITSVAFVVQFVDPVLTDASSTPFTALGAGWSVYYFFAVVLGTAAHYATNSAFMAKFARPSGALESTYVGVSPEMLEVAMDDPTRYRPVSASIVFLLLTSVFSTGLFALGPLYDAIPRVGTPASGLTSDASISVGKAYSRFANGFTQCIFRDRDAYNCGNWHTFIGVGVGCRIAVTVGVAIGAQFGPLCPMISLFAASTLRRLAMALWPDWSPVFQLYMSAGEVAEAVIALVLFGIGFVVWMVWDIRSRREVARNEGDAVNFTLDRAAYHPGYHSGPHTYQPVTLTEGFAPNKAEA